MKYKIIDQRADGRVLYVVAPVGHSRCKGGGYVKDGTPSPEMSATPGWAFEFATHRAAARTRNKMGETARIVPELRSAYEGKSTYRVIHDGPIEEKT